MTLKFKWLVIGGTGMLGSAIQQHLASLEQVCFCASRNSIDYPIDITSLDKLNSLITSLKPDFVINCVAITDLELCETKPRLAKEINGLSVGDISSLSRAVGARFIQVSTDAFYHLSAFENTEKSTNIKLPTQYSKSKYAGELACSAQDLIIRTSFIGRKDNKRSLLDFYVGALLAGDHIPLYDDVITSSLDVNSCASLIVKLSQGGAEGVFNLGTTKPYKKSDLFFRLQAISGLKTTFDLVNASAHEQYKGNILQGMNVEKIECYLNRTMPSLEDVVHNLKDEGYLNDLCQSI